MSKTKFGERAYQAFMSQPKLLRGAEIAIVGGVVVFAIVLPIIKFVRGKLDQSKTQREVVQAGKEVQKLAKQGIHPTISKAQAESMSNTLKVSFSGLGTSTLAVYDVFKQLKNEADLFLLIDVYGIRTYQGAWWWNDAKKFTLSEAINDEMGVDQRRHLNKILSDKGIKFQF